MNYADISILFISLLLSAYVVLSSMQAAAAISIIKDKSKTRPLHLLSPAWELSDIFLLLGTAAALILFNTALHPVGRQLAPALVLGSTAITVKVGTVLLLAGSKLDKEAGSGVIIAAIYALVLSLSAASAYLITGSRFYYTLYGWVILLTAVSGLMALLTTYSQATYKLASVAWAEISFSIWMLMLGCVLPLAAIHSRAGYDEIYIAVTAGLALAGLCLQLVKLVYKSKHGLWPYAAFVGLISPALLLLSNRPYLINGQLTLNNSFSARTQAHTAVLILIIITPLLLVCFWLMEAAGSAGLKNKTK